MRITPHEQERLLIHVAADVARARRARGLLLNHPESVAILTDWVLEGARDGRTVADLMEAGRHVLDPRRRDGGRARDDRRGPGRGDVPRRHQARHVARPDRHRARVPMIPGEVVGPDDDDRAQRRAPGRDAARRERAATGPSRSARTTTSPRPTRRWRSTAPRPAACRLDIPAGTAVRFEPGIAIDVDARAARRRIASSPGCAARSPARSTPVDGR